MLWLYTAIAHEVIILYIANLYRYKIIRWGKHEMPTVNLTRADFQPHHPTISYIVLLHVAS